MLNAYMSKNHAFQCIKTCVYFIVYRFMNTWCITYLCFPAGHLKARIHHLITGRHVLLTFLNVYTRLVDRWNSYCFGRGVYPFHAHGSVKDCTGIPPRFFVWLEKILCAMPVTSLIMDQNNPHTFLIYDDFCVKNIECKGGRWEQQAFFSSLSCVYTHLQDHYITQHTKHICPTYTIPPINSPHKQNQHTSQRSAHGACRDIIIGND